MGIDGEAGRSLSTKHGSRERSLKCVLQDTCPPPVLLRRETRSLPASGCGVSAPRPHRRSHRRPHRRPLLRLSHKPGAAEAAGSSYSPTLLGQQCPVPGRGGGHCLSFVRAARVHPRQLPSLLRRWGVRLSSPRSPLQPQPPLLSLPAELHEAQSCDSLQTPPRRLLSVIFLGPTLQRLRTHFPAVTAGRSATGSACLCWAEALTVAAWDSRWRHGTRVESSGGQGLPPGQGCPRGGAIEEVCGCATQRGTLAPSCRMHAPGTLSSRQECELEKLKRHLQTADTAQSTGSSNRPEALIQNQTVLGIPAA